MSLYNLIVHSFSIIAVFKYIVLLRSIIFIILFFFLKIYLGFFSYIFIFLITIFCFLIFLVSTREKKDELINSQENLKYVEEISH